MAISEGLKTSLNAIREISSEIYHQYVPIIDDDTDIAVNSGKGVIQVNVSFEQLH